MTNFKHFLFFFGVMFVFFVKLGFSQEEKPFTFADDNPGYGKYRAGDFLIYSGIGYANNGFYTYKQNKNIYETKNPISVPPISFFTDYSLLDFLAIGSEFTYFSYTEEAIGEGVKLDMFMFKFRSSFHYTFSIVDIYLGGSIGMYGLYASGFQVKELFDVIGTSQFSYSAFTGLRVILGNSFFLFAETGYPFPIFIGGIGVKF